MIGAETLGAIGAFVTLLSGVFLKIYVAHAKEAREDREQARAHQKEFLKFVRALVAEPKGAGDSNPPNGRTKLLVEQTHSMSERMERSFAGLEKQACEQTKCIKVMSEEMGTMNRDSKARIELFKQIIEQRRPAYPKEAEIAESEKGHSI